LFGETLEVGPRELAPFEGVMTELQPSPEERQSGVLAKIRIRSADGTNMALVLPPTQSAKGAKATISLGN
jgi:hypothetical protein